MKPQTSCCHVCKTSLNQYKRDYLPCTDCNKIVCKNCFGTRYRGSTWEEAKEVKESGIWICPSCDGTCPCIRCRKKNFTKGFPQVLEVEPMKRAKNECHQLALVEKLKPSIHKVMLAQYEDLLEREKRCNNNMREMERFLMVLRREREEIALERAKMEDVLLDGDSLDMVVAKQGELLSFKETDDDYMEESFDESSPIPWAYSSP